MKYAVFFVLVLIQGMSYTFVSRARNQDNFKIALIASVASNIAYLLILRKLITDFSDIAICVLYVLAMTLGTILQMKISIKYIERHRR